MEEVKQFISGMENRFLEGSQALPAYPSDEGIVKMKTLQRLEIMA
jgi:hypothetical protein